ncbi:beta-ketoacyl-ACP reductase [Novipirellula sp.]|uniref:beta-ketoacyl-ACP reductase n=1 Tax=Novipirellula sp. TaxID=2795430 RepID=UPI003562AD30
MSAELQQVTYEPFEQPCLSLQGKKALVTGGSRGIGKAIALTLAAQGADVALTYYTGCKFAEDVCAQIRDMGRLSGCYAHDIGDRETVHELRPHVIEDLGQVDILINNAGIARDRSFKKMSIEMWDDVLAVNLTGVFHMAKQFVDDMADRGWGRIVNISSVVGEVGNFGQANYAAAKAGVLGLTKTLAREYARKGVTVNAIAPGFIKTRMMQGIPDSALQAVINQTPMGRLGDPSEIAAGVAFLSSPAAGFITGHVLDINGGIKM